MSALNARKERERGAQVMSINTSIIFPERRSSDNFVYDFQLEAAISSQLEVNMALEQDAMEGVDESEWVKFAISILIRNEFNYKHTFLQDN